MYNFYIHSVKSDIKYAVIFLILLNKVGQINNRCKDRKLRPCKGSVTLTLHKEGGPEGMGTWGVIPTKFYLNFIFFTFHFSSTLKISHIF